MFAKGYIRHEMCLHSSAHNLPRHVLADVDRRRQQARIRAQRYRETHGDHKRAADAARRRLCRQRENNSRSRLLPKCRYAAISA